MEISILSFLPALVFLYIALTILRTFKNKSNGPTTRLPPGSFGWPIVGETMAFVFGKPEDFVRYRMKKYSTDIFKTNLFGEKTVVVCGPEGHKFIFSNEEKLFTKFRAHSMQRLFRSYNAKADSAPTPPPPVIHRDSQVAVRQRGIFKADVLVRCLGGMDAMIQQQLKIHWEGKKEVEAYRLTKMISLSYACTFAMGIDDPERVGRLVKHFDNVTLGLYSMICSIPGTTFYRANKAAAAIRKEILCVIKEKKMAMANGEKMLDTLSLAIASPDSSGRFMPEVEIADKVIGFITAQYSTVATAMVFLLKFVGVSPDIYNKIRAEQMEIASSKTAGEFLKWEDMKKMKYSWNAICETMRLVPPLQGSFREVLNEFTYAGYTIPKGWKVYWTMSSVNMNPNYFPNPDVFDPSRFGEDNVVAPPYTYVPFGGGPRLCPGNEYARLMILAFLHNVVNQYKWEVLYPDEKISSDMVARPMKGLPIRLQCHH